MGLEVGFCESDMTGFSLTQPADHIERWSLPQDNGTHLEIPWMPHGRACGMNVTGYYVDVKTSASFLNLFVHAFGSFPQDMCDPGVQARRRPRRRRRVALRGPVPRRERLATFVIPSALRQLLHLDIEVVRASGALAPRTAAPEPVTHWCHVYRKAKGPSADEPLALAPRKWWSPKTWRKTPAPGRAPFPPSAAPPTGVVADAFAFHRDRMASLEPALVAASAPVYVALCYLARRRRRGAKQRAPGAVCFALLQLLVGVAIPALFVSTYVVKGKTRTEDVVVEDVRTKLLDHESDTDDDEDTADLNALDDWLVDTDRGAKAPPVMPAAPPPPPPKPVSLAPVLAYHALGAGHYGYLFCWCEPALGRAFGPAPAALATLAVALLGDDAPFSANRAYALGALCGLPALLGGSLLAAAPVAYAVDAAANDVERGVDLPDARDANHRLAALLLLALAAALLQF
ncbi:hypothetical protein JL722_219 [Aureococcus anophagefferens]|nr:hypothetical protein JL722_219 [Aureococcus anophagefferens]